MKEEYWGKSDPDILRPGSRLPAEGSVRRPRASAIKLYEIRVYKVNVFSKVFENFSFYPLRPHAARAPEESRVLLRADPEALAGYRGRAVNPKPREAEFSAAGVFFRFYGQGLSLEKSCGAGGFSGSCLWQRTAGRFPSLRYQSREARGLPGPLRSTESPPGTAGKLRSPFRKNAFTAKPGIPSFSHQGCPIRDRLLSLNIQEKGLVYHPVGAVP